MKNLLILGDSYSTYEGQVAKGCAVYYFKNGSSPDLPVSKMELEETWWHRMLEATGVNLVMNNSWSGSTFSYTGYRGDCSQTSSFICRYRKLKASNFFAENNIDTVIVFGGTNDSWVPAPLGELKLSDWKEEDFVCALPAISYLVYSLKTDLPDVRVIFIINCDIKEEIICGIKTACDYFGAETIVLHDIEKESGHPNPRGMAQICEQVLARL